MKSVFISHGAPTIALEQNEFTRTLQRFGATYKPEAILIFSAHYERPSLHITYTDEPYETIHDFGGFSEHLYQLTYPARGSKKIADQIVEAFKAHQIPVKKDGLTGLDHGSWTVLNHLYPEANIPVIQLSVNPFLNFKKQYETGHALSELHDQNYLVVGSGATVHNLRLLEWEKQTPDEWAVEFDDWLLDRLKLHHTEKLFRLMELAPYASRAVPRAEHFVPILLAFGAAGESSRPEVLHRHYEFGNLSYLFVEFC